jgi:hypothetical protein
LPGVYELRDFSHSLGQEQPFPNSGMWIRASP